MQLSARLPDRYRVVSEVGQVERLEHPAPVGVRVGAHASVAARREFRERRYQPAVLVEQLVRPVTAHPLLELAEMVGVVADIGERNLMGAEGAFDGLPVYDLRAGPALRGAQHDGR